MPTARPKMKSRKRSRVDGSHLDNFTDVEVRQCSPHLCAICEGAGDLVICDGPCHRQFHCFDSIQAPDAACPGVLIPHATRHLSWECPDCSSAMAKCFQCGHRGSQFTDVRPCPILYCMRWYCRACLPLDVSSCPVHKCLSCQQGYESESLEDAVQCLRCPVSWHLDCLRQIRSKDIHKTIWGDDRPPWQHEAHDQMRWMCYCPKHPIDPTLKTPLHDHISWI